MMIKKGRKTQEEPAYTGPSVSELLKTTRERTGQDLQTVAQVLRIRFVYLEAIEDGRYEDLPGKTYVVGFVRAYSEHLGLDAEEVVKQFKDEISGLEGKAELVFPSPVTEQSVPGGAIILIGLIILGGAYGGWYFLSSQDRSMAELVPDLPAKFAEMVDNVKNDKKETSPEPVVNAEPVVETTETAPEPSPVSEEDTQDMAQKALEAVEKAEEEAEEVIQTVEMVKVEDVVEQTTQDASDKIEETTEEKKEEVVEPVQTAVEEEKQEVAEKTETVAETVEEKVQETTEAVEGTIEETTEEVVAETEVASVEPQVMTEKIVLKSIYDSWFQIVNASGTVLHTGVLKEGLEYQIPSTSGLFLRTGNAGGIEIYVDGEKAPSLGEIGDVRRKVLLDPKKLLSGTAVES